MAYKGQPVPSSVHNIGYGKISDGKSVKVTVPENTKIEAGKFYLLNGFLGCAMQSVETGAEETAEVILSIEQAEYETDQTKEADRATMAVGTDIYWDKDNKYFTLSGTDIYAGKITAAVDENGVIWFKLAERPFSLDDVTTLADQVGTLDDLTTTAKNSIVAAINEINAKVAEKVDPIANVENLSVSNATDLQTVATQLNTLLTALTAAGLMAADE
jgi:predicted RecA/RadA family phage recombinase